MAYYFRLYFFPCTLEFERLIIHARIYFSHISAKALEILNNNDYLPYKTLLIMNKGGDYHDKQPN